MMKCLLLILFFSSVLYFSSSNAESLVMKHSDATVGGSIVRGEYKRSSDVLKDHPISKIGIQRTVCYGSCPSYLLTITNEGDVYYEGFGSVERRGVHEGKIGLYYISNLFEYINQSNFFDLEDTYSALITDLPSVYTLVEKNGKEKIVQNYANVAPLFLWSIEEHISSLLGKIEWDDEID